ncbi:MAG TPA: ACT domain-containing protein, partial [Candidatus Saccharimonadia bacterium]|nr:ACT domain-containing protein [Candidatus Saccharimonadia bacterium]
TWGVKRLEDLPKRQVSDVIDGMHLRSADDMLLALGDGSVAVSQIIRRLIPDAAKPKGATVVRRTEPTGRVLIEGEKLHYTLALCCQPRFPQPLIGYVTRGKGVTVHQLGCKNVPQDADRYVTCRWETSAASSESIVCQLEIRSVNRIGLITEVAGVIADGGHQIAALSAKPIPDTAETIQSLGVEVPDLFALDRLIRKLERIPGVIWVRRLA